MGFPARHPRYTIALVVLLFVSVLVFSNSDSSPAYLSRPYPLAFRKHGDRPPPSPGYVEDQIRTSEAYYQASLKERQKLITKWGPSPSQVDAFPSHGEFYTLCKNMCQRACDRLTLSLHRGLLHTGFPMPAPDATHWHTW